MLSNKINILYKKIKKGVSLALESSMDIILKKIIETDTVSRQRVNDKKQRLLSLDTEITEAKNAIDEELFERSKKSIAKQTETAEIKLKKQLAEIDSLYAESEARLRSAFEENRDRQIEEIFKRVTE